ncbi:hypothetical protein M419DRAFT_38164 [Trichoderma reesei RUT C-30]|uniref:Uncharacterized protein n=1 Tax=Hypocrea jecorina (strain ATCC 56765 / BCRC 32924 / NRRL 11460 / Rut C-30) TaxID=1344414 RepID=A0A024S3H5_HYPJR|nr:hypothetical protein M419DRAFT_38164 [Trichoderma reesei RUT C-30]
MLLSSICPKIASSYLSSIQELLLVASFTRNLYLTDIEGRYHYPSRRETRKRQVSMGLTSLRFMISTQEGPDQTFAPSVNFPTTNLATRPEAAVPARRKIRHHRNPTPTANTSTKGSEKHSLRSPTITRSALQPSHTFQPAATTQARILHTETWRLLLSWPLISWKRTNGRLTFMVYSSPA